MPTIRQKKAFKEVVKGSTLTKAMSVAGYSPSAVKRTNKLTNTLGWKELLETELPDGLLAERHRELLDKRETISHYEMEQIDGKEMKVYSPIDIGPDVQAVTKGLDMAYKIKGTYAPEKSVNLNVEVVAPSERIKELAKKLNEG